jgi:hypothetical protein
MSPILPAPSLPFPDRSGTVGPAMFEKSRSMIGPAAKVTSAAAGDGNSEAPALEDVPTHMHAHSTFVRVARKARIFGLEWRI